MSLDGISALGNRMLSLFHRLFLPDCQVLTVIDSSLQAGDSIQITPNRSFGDQCVMEKLLGRVFFWGFRNLVHFLEQVDDFHSTDGGVIVVKAKDGS